MKLAIEGTIVMSDTLRGLLDSMYDAKVPPVWEKVSWQSTTLGFWYTELLERDGQFRRWCFHGRPKVFWVTGFFNPQGFLTAMRQEVTRSHKGWALDSVICQNLVTRFAKEDIHDSPPEGVYIHGKLIKITLIFIISSLKPNLSGIIVNYVVAFFLENNHEVSRHNVFLID